MGLTGLDRVHESARDDPLCSVTAKLLIGNDNVIAFPGAAANDDSHGMSDDLPLAA